MICVKTCRTKDQCIVISSMCDWTNISFFFRRRFLNNDLWCHMGLKALILFSLDKGAPVRIVASSTISWGSW